MVVTQKAHIKNPSWASAVQVNRQTFMPNTLGGIFPRVKVCSDTFDIHLHLNHTIFQIADIPLMNSK